ncbi:hypothetical protein HPB51_023323 [Rhipicephalus microplus]|uniref:Uncharacterized protein n=1 Tax=Rhipicephalus microplus TaxID=6941 RepID=A0A9J6EDJ7_RHIMP|nr:hypothetical protein HPB51_023323 [Rhipicephalus microplus]
MTDAPEDDVPGLPMSQQTAHFTPGIQAPIFHTDLRTNRRTPTTEGVSPSQGKVVTICVTVLPTFELATLPSISPAVPPLRVALRGWSCAGRMARPDSALCDSRVFPCPCHDFLARTGMLMKVASGGYRDGPTSALRNIATPPVVTAACRSPDVLREQEERQQSGARSARVSHSDAKTGPSVSVVKSGLCIPISVEHSTTTVNEVPATLVIDDIIRK